MAFNPASLEVGRLYTRPELADLWGYRGFQAISRGVVTPRGSRCIIFFVTRQKQDSLTQYRDFISGDYLHWEGEARHGSDERVARAHERGDEIHLFYRDIHHTPFRYHGPLELRQFIPRQDGPSEFVFRLVHDMSPEDDVRSHRVELENVPETEREALIKARLGQGEFRKRLLEDWRGCAVTGIASPELLRASHIKPWRMSSNDDRLNPFNGLMLLPQYDHLFDRGYITFEDNGRLVPSPAIVTLPPHLLGLAMDARLRHVASDHLPYLDFHRNKVFLARTERE
jgi:putative restriction endonuclease